MYVGKRIKQLRITNDLNQSEMASKLGVSQPYYSAVESGKKPITNKMLMKLNFLFSVDISYFTEKEDQETGYINGGSIFQGVKNSPPPTNSREYHNRSYNGFEIKKDTVWLSVYNSTTEKLQKVEFYYQRLVDIKTIIHKELKIKVGDDNSTVSFEKKIIDKFGGDIIHGNVRAKNSTINELRIFNNDLFDLNNILELRFFELFSILYKGLSKTGEIPNQIE